MFQNVIQLSTSAAASPKANLPRGQEAALGEGSPRRRRPATSTRTIPAAEHAVHENQNRNQ